MFACFLFPTTVSFETIGQIQPNVMERNKLKDTRFQQWKQAARMERLLFRRNGWSGSSAFIGKSMKQSVKIIKKKENLLPRSAPSWIIFIVREIFLFPFLMPKFLLLYESVALSALVLSIGSEILSQNHHYLLNCVFPFKNRFLLDHVMLFYVTQRLWGFFLSACGISGRWR